MDRFRGLLVRFRSLWKRAAAEHDLDDELRFHVAMEIEAGCARGLAPDEARRRALVTFGGVERFREETRDADRPRWLDEARADFVHAWRLVLSRPGFSAAVVLTLGLGVGANTAIFSIVNAVLLRPSPFPHPDRLVMIWETDRQSGTRHEPASWPDVVDFGQRSRTLQAIGAMTGRDVTLTRGGASEPERVTGLAITPSVLSVLGVRVIAGRPFAADEGRPGGQDVVLLGEQFWRTRFSADPAVVGHTILVDERPALVAGVLPEAADLGVRQIHERADYAETFSSAHVDVWLALQPSVDSFPRERHPFLTVGRLAPGATPAAAQRELSTIAAALEREYPVNAHRGVNIESYGSVVFGAVRPALVLLFGAVTLLLLVTCANVANLLLARTAARTREVAVRIALGAGRARIARQFLVESLVYVVLGGMAGVVLAFAALHGLVALAPSDVPRIDTASIDGRVAAYTAGTALLIGILFAALPALQMRRLDLRHALKSHGGRLISLGRSARRFQACVIVAEVALTVMLVIGAGLLLRSLWRLSRVDPGFDTTRVLEAQYQLPSTRYPIDFKRFPDIPAINAFHARMLSAVRAIPGVAAAALAANPPLDPGFTNSFTIVGREAESAHFPEIRTRFVSPGYLETLGVPLLGGRAINESDDAHSPNVIVINRAAARRYFAAADPIGQSIAFWGAARRIVGIIGDEKFRGVDAPSDPAVYAPIAQAPLQQATILVRASHGDPMALAPDIRAALRELDPQVGLFGVEPLALSLRSSIAKPRFDAVLLAAFGGVAILLAVIGVYGVLSYTVTERMPELGVRMALGANRWSVIRLVAGMGIGLAALGVALGLGAAYAGSRLLRSMVFGVTTTDPVTFVGVILIVMLTAVAASLGPALRATRADPMQALRAES